MKKNLMVVYKSLSYLENVFYITNMEQTQGTITKEKCVSCGVETPHHFHEHIDYRYYYVEGAGQLCKNCYDNIYNKTTPTDELQKI
jgi:recombinational DNA repair protein (RecF pathway)